MSLMPNFWVQLLQLQVGFYGFVFLFFPGRRENRDVLLQENFNISFLKDVLLFPDLVQFHTYTSCSVGTGIFTW